MLENLRSVKSYIQPLFNFQPKLFLRKRTFVFLFLSIFYGAQNFHLSHSFGCLNRLFTKVCLYITCFFSVAEFWFCFIGQMLLNLEFFSHREVMKCLQCYSINIKKPIVVIIQHLLSVHRVLGVEYRYSGGKKGSSSHRFFFPHNIFVMLYLLFISSSSVTFCGSSHHSA